MSDYSAVPDELRLAANRLNALADRAQQLHRSAVDGQSSPTVADFPKTEMGQRAGTLWEQARPVFADGLSVAAVITQRIAARFIAAASDYEATDTAAADRIRGTR